MHHSNQPCDHEHYNNERCDHQTSVTGVAQYQNYGIQFQFPSSWELDEQINDDDITITVQSAGTSFWTAVIFTSQPDPEEVLDTVVAAFEQDYEDVDVSPVVASFCGVPALGRDLDFVCYDLINSSTLRAFQTTEQTILVLYQGTDHELESTREMLESISRSMRFIDDEELEHESP